MAKNKIYRAAMYLRLSEADEETDESNSIKNQRDLILDFAAKRPDIRIASEKIDDGYSGIHFSRPAFQEMIQEIREGKLDCIIVKDLSRFGRNYIETGMYLERLFPDLGVRFIAVNDGIDRLKPSDGGSEITIPFRNLMNDSYSRDLSIKIRSQFETKRKKGAFIGAFAAYGYRKDPECKNHLLPDPQAAGVVRDIFRWRLWGISPGRIADRLNRYAVLPPGDYKISCGLRYATGFQTKFRSKWTATTVRRILVNEIYTGKMVQGKRLSPNYKVKKRLNQPPDAWIKVADTQEALVTKEVFDQVQMVMAVDSRVAPGKEQTYLFSGGLVCADCSAHLVRRVVRSGAKQYTYYLCNTYKLDSTQCTSHAISEALLYKTLYQIVSLVFAVEGICISEYGKRISDFENGRLKCYLSQAEKEQERLYSIRKSLAGAYEDGLMDRKEQMQLDSMYQEVLSTLRVRIQKMQEELLQKESQAEKDAAEEDGYFLEERGILCELAPRIFVISKNRITLEVSFGMPW